MFTDYIWPQVIARLPFEEKWDRLQRMYEVKRNYSRPRQQQSLENQTINTGADAPVELADTIIFDTVDRLKNLSYFIQWKDRPVQFNRPRDVYTSMEDQFYSPTTRKLRSANALLDWNNDAMCVREKDLKLKQHYYLYGLAFVYSDFTFEIDTDQTSQDFLLVKNIGTTFEPVSIRKLWLNPLLPVDQMEKQVCPMWFDLQLRGNILKNVYDPKLNPFGFANLDMLQSPQWLFGPESKSFTDGLPEQAQTLMTQMRPEFSGEALWTFLPYLTLPGSTETKRYIVQCFANNLFSGGITPLRIQELYYPKKELPLYGCSHIPDLDSGLYTPSIAEILETHYDEIVRAKQQYVLNKDWINNPPTEVMQGSPAANDKNINRPGHQVEVIGLNDVTRRTPYDATITTLHFIEQIREQAQTSGKAVDAILGQAMGGRTTATEASNAFQASMSGVTTDIDHFGVAIYKQYARRVFANCGKFMPENIRNRITGNSDAPSLDPQDFLLELGVKCDTGSSFIESIVKQQHLQQAILSATTSPVLDQAILWKALFRELKLTEAMDAVQDNGLEFQIYFVTNQAIESYNGLPVAIDPSQDHNVAIKVLTRFLQDTSSIYNETMAGLPSAMPGMTRAQYIASQIQIHQQFVMLQMQQQMNIQQAQLADANRIQQQEHQVKMQKSLPSSRTLSSNHNAANPTPPPKPSPTQGVPSGPN